jgi:hypothetical protein
MWWTIYLIKCLLSLHNHHTMFTPEIEGRAENPNTHEHKDTGNHKKTSPKEHYQGDEL